MDGVKVMGFGKLEFGWVGQPLPKIWDTLGHKLAKNMAARAVLEAKNGHKWP